MFRGTVFFPVTVYKAKIIQILIHACALCFAISTICMLHIIIRVTLVSHSRS